MYACGLSLSRVATEVTATKAGRLLLVQLGRVDITLAPVIDRPPASLDQGKSPGGSVEAV